MQFVKNERNQGGERRRSGKRGRHSSAVGHKGPGTGDTVQWTPGSSSTNAVIKLLLMKNIERVGESKEKSDDSCYAVTNVWLALLLIRR